MTDQEKAIRDMQILKIEINEIDSFLAYYRLASICSSQGKLADAYKMILKCGGIV